MVDEFVVEAAEIGPGLARHERDGHVNGVDAGIAANVIGDVLAYADDGIGVADARGLGFAGKGAIGAEGKRQRGAHQINDARAGLRVRVRAEAARGRRWSRDHVGAKGGGFCDECRAQLGVGGGANVDAVAIRSSVAPPSDDAAFVAARGESFHQQRLDFSPPPWAGW